MIVARPRGPFSWVWPRLVWCVASGVAVACGDRSPPALWPDPPPPTLAAPIGVDDDPSDDEVEVPRAPGAVPAPGVTTASDAAAQGAASDAKPEPKPNPKPNPEPNPEPEANPEPEPSPPTRRDAKRSDAASEPTSRAKPSPQAP